MYDLVIVGGGIAGQTAALYAALKRMNFIMITKELGGQFYESGQVLNYPGIVESTGLEFGQRMEEQLKRHNINPIEGEEMTGIEKTPQGFIITTNKNKYETRTAIIATGAKHRRLNVPGEDTYVNKGVTYCAICDGPLFRNMDIAIIGAGNSAFEAVDYTRDVANRIYVLNNSDEWHVHEYLLEKVKKYDNVKLITNARTVGIKGEKMVSGLDYETGGVVRTLDVRGVIVEIGRAPNTSFLEGFLKLDPWGYIEIDCQTKTSVPGIFAAGDCASGYEYQYVIAAGQGCMALLKAARYLASKDK